MIDKRWLAHPWVQTVSAALAKIFYIVRQESRPRHSWTPLNKTLHISFATLMVLQLLNSNLMHNPWVVGKVVSDVAAFFFYVHLIMGILTLIVLLGYLFTNLHPVARAHLYPWDLNGRRQVREDLLQLWQQHKMQPAHSQGGLAGLVHGLGFLVALATAFIGGLWLLLDKTGYAAEWVLMVKEVHEFMTNFVWAYLIGHTLMAVVHFLLENYSPADPNP